jgi:hypothetical protein
LSAAQRKGATIAGIVHQLTRLAEQKPVLFVLEDAHDRSDYAGTGYPPH